MPKIIWSQEVKTTTNYETQKFLWWKWKIITGTSSELRQIGTIDSVTTVSFAYKRQPFIMLRFERWGQMTQLYPMRSPDPFKLHTTEGAIQMIRDYIEENHEKIYPKKHDQNFGNGLTILESVKFEGKISDDDDTFFMKH